MTVSVVCCPLSVVKAGTQGLLIKPNQLSQLNQPNKLNQPSKAFLKRSARSGPHGAIKSKMPGGWEV